MVHTIFNLILEGARHLPSIAHTIKEKRIRHAEHNWRSKNDFISDVLQWTSTHGHTSVNRPTNIYVYYLNMANGCRLENLISGDRERRMAIESHRNPCSRNTLMMIMTSVDKLVDTVF